MSRKPAGTQRSVASQQLVLEPQRTRRPFSYGRPDHDFLIVAERSDEPAAGLGDDQQEPSLLDLGIGDAGLAAEVGSADLEPDEIVRVMCDRHLIGLGIADTCSRFNRSSIARLFAHGGRHSNQQQGRSLAEVGTPVAVAAVCIQTALTMDPRSDSSDASKLIASVGAASLPVRLLLAAIFFVVAVVLLFAAWILSADGSAIAAVIVCVPAAVASGAAAAFVALPHSRFGSSISSSETATPALMLIAIAVFLTAVIVVLR